MSRMSSGGSRSPPQERPAKRQKVVPAAAAQQHNELRPIPTGSPPVASTSGRVVTRPVAAKTAPAAQSKVKPAAKQAPAPEDEDGMWMVVGLGNPGKNYERTRHNVGFMVVDELARSEGIECRKLEKSAAVGKGDMCGKQVLLVKPVTFMNNSGEAVAALARFYKVPTTRVLVISDDLDMPTGALRLRAKGGHGGHNGLRSVIERFGNSQDFPRLKIGIGRPAGDLPIATYVLQDFSKREAEEIDVAVREGVDVVRSILTIGMAKALAGERA